MKKHSLILILLFFAVLEPFAQEEVTLTESSRACLECHGSMYYKRYNSFTEVHENKFMNPHFIVDSVEYLQGVHKQFACYDCHNPDYETYPHAAELKLEPQYSCLDCHGGDEMFAEFYFDEIALEVEKSVHYKKFGMAFNCEKCHDPHTYKLMARSNEMSIRQLVAKNNETCITCHSDLDHYHLLSTDDKPELSQTHSWLPNQSLHFNSVRCIECHTPVDDTLMVSHQVLKKDEAVRKCKECHGKNSLLSSKLYKYRAKEVRTEAGFYNAIVLNEAYVIGANRNKYLNNISLVIFGLTLGGIIVHIFMRIIKK